ncbi:MAG: LamG domain-containing protein [Opitutaceae bacterium]|nr:LamG domain-containing protein [Opitutaceae bacterium]
MKNRTLHTITGTALAVLVSATALPAATFLHEFTFNDPANGASTTSSGTLGGSALMTNYVETGSSTRVSADLHSTDGLGVSGKVGDYAFDNTAATRMGGGGAINGTNAGYGGSAILANGSASLNGMNSFTISGWYNTASTTAPGNYARLIELGSAGGGVWFQTGAGLQLSMSIGGATGAKLASLDTRLFQTNTWTFFAFTYDGDTGLLSLYAGTKTSGQLELITSDTLANKGIVSTATNQGLAIGNSVGNDQQRPFQGLLDNFRIRGETTGSGGALTQQQLQQIMTTDITGPTIPEPSATALVFGAVLPVAAAACVLRSRRKL